MQDVALYAAQIGTQADYYGHAQSSDDEVRFSFVLHNFLPCSDVHSKYFQQRDLSRWKIERS